MGLKGVLRQVPFSSPGWESEDSANTLRWTRKRKVGVNLPWASVAPDAAATFPPSPMTSRLTVAPETADPPDVTVTVIVAELPGAIVTADEATATARARTSGATVIHAEAVAPA